MNYPLAISVYVGIMIAVLHGAWLVAALGGLFFSFRYGALALVPLAFLLDGYMGAFHGIPMMSIGATLWYALCELIRVRFKLL
ncbi:MAG: hypothetical protein AAB388_01330 [Patescibacteria group bacterium]